VPGISPRIDGHKLSGADLEAWFGVWGQDEIGKQYGAEQTLGALEVGRLVDPREHMRGIFLRKTVHDEIPHFVIRVSASKQ
jgi:hypothetical protein